MILRQEFLLFDDDVVHGFMESIMYRAWIFESYQFFEFRLVPEHFSKRVYGHLVTYAASSQHDDFDHIHEVIDMFVFPLG